MRLRRRIERVIDRSGLATEYLDTVATEVWEYPRDGDALGEMFIQLSKPEHKGPPSG